MEAGHLKVRFNVHQGELEVAGTDEQVERWFDKLFPIVSGVHPPSSSLSGNAVSPPHLESGLGTSEDSPTFGEFLHGFKGNLSDTERVLIAGAYLQQNSPDSVFKTGDANEILKTQGLRVANASEAVRRNLMAKRVFALVRGSFRVSEMGWNHVKELRS